MQIDEIHEVGKLEIFAEELAAADVPQDINLILVWQTMGNVTMKQTQPNFSQLLPGFGVEKTLSLG